MIDAEVLMNEDARRGGGQYGMDWEYDEWGFVLPGGEEGALRSTYYQKSSDSVLQYSVNEVMVRDR